MTERSNVHIQGAAPRPSGPSVLSQTWTDLLFMHWPADPAAVQALVPSQLTVDTFDGQAWIAILPFAMSNIRASFLPAIPGLSATLELNVRTYVKVEGKPGVYFFSLEAEHPLVVWGARTLFHLRYMRARMNLKREGDLIDYSSTRIHRGEPEAEFRARWEVGAALPMSEPGSIAHFLTERYCLYTVHRNRAYCGHIHHAPWSLREATLHKLESSMFAGHELVAQDVAPLLHHADRLDDVKVWPLARLP